MYSDLISLQDLAELPTTVMVAVSSQVAVTLVRVCLMINLIAYLDSGVGEGGQER